MSRIRVGGAILVAWALVVAVASIGVLGHERTLAQGELVLLQLAPVDPRSLMQGDYMALRFAVDDLLSSVPVATAEPDSKRPRFAHFTHDDQGRAQFQSVGEMSSSGAGQISMRIRRVDGRYSIGPNAFFFQEGTGEQFEAARWGGFRVANNGSALLVSLHDAELQKIGDQSR